jgi:hypothetical protein
MHFTATLLKITSLLSLAAASPLANARRDDAAATSTVSAPEPCPTTPEAGTYCGFINPEDPCAPQPKSQGAPVMSPDTVAAFSSYTPFQDMSLNSVAQTGYNTVFKNKTSAANVNDYVGLYLMDSYNVEYCAQKCNSVAGCNSFNVYVERDPSLNPTKNDSTAPTVWGYWCPDPASDVNFKCALWADGIWNSSATNYGQYRGGDFKVVIAGSNAYVKSSMFNSTSYQSGPASLSSSRPSSTNSSRPGASSPVPYTGAAGAGAVAKSSAWGVGLLAMAVMMVL